MCGICTRLRERLHLRSRVTCAHARAHMRSHDAANQARVHGGCAYVVLRLQAADPMIE